MKKRNDELLIQGEALGVSQVGMLQAEMFLRSNYLLRRNVLNGKVEFANKPKNEGEEPLWKPLTQTALNSIVIRAKREQVMEDGASKQDIMEYVNSDEVDTFDPARDYLEHLPRWDGENHVAQLFQRLPGVDSELMGYLATWLRSAVAHWMQMAVITREFPSLKDTHSVRIALGRAMKAFGFESTDCGHVAHYKVVPLKSAA